MPRRPPAPKERPLSLASAVPPAVSASARATPEPAASDTTPSRAETILVASLLGLIVLGVLEVVWAFVTL